MTARARRMLALMDRATTHWHIPVIGRAKSRLLRRLIERHRPRRAIEIGSLLGYSAIVIGSALPPRGKLVCVEANPFLASLVEANVEEAGLRRRVKVVTGDALRAIPLLSGRFDFALIDADKQDYLDYLRQLEPRLTPGAVVVADNTGRHRPARRGTLSRVRAHAQRRLPQSRIRLRGRRHGSLDPRRRRLEGTAARKPALRNAARRSPWTHS
jgi:predicted O-methyltransferase YrrM